MFLVQYCTPSSYDLWIRSRYSFDNVCLIFGFKYCLKVKKGDFADNNAIVGVLV